MFAPLISLEEFQALEAERKARAASLGLTWLPTPGRQIATTDLETAFKRADELTLEPVKKHT